MGTHWPCPPKGVSGLPSQLCASYGAVTNPVPTGKSHLTSLCSSSLLAKHILVNCLSVWSFPGKIKVLAQSVTSGTTDRNYHKWQKYREWEYIWQNMNNCMNIHYKNMTLWGFLNIFLRHHITWGVVFEWVMVITDCCKLKHYVICSLSLMLSKGKFLLNVWKTRFKHHRKRLTICCSSAVELRNELHV